MADYRKRLVDMTDEERAEVAPGAPQFSEEYENVDDPLSVQMMSAGLDFTPVGTVKGISDIKDELSKDDPNYLKAIGMGAVEAAALIPGAAPVLKGMLKGSFKTSKGSVYDVFDDSTTVRNRAERGDSESVGIQPRSGKTIYMTKEGVDQLGSLFQNTEIPVQFVPVDGGKAKLVYTQDYGPKKAGMDASPEVPYTLDPEVGLHPVEILDSRNTNRRNIHFGNDITVVESNVPSTKGTNKQVSNTEYDARMTQLDEASDAETWQKNTKEFVKESRDVNPTVRTPELESSTMDLIDGKITREQHLKNVDQFKPVDPWDALPREPSDKATVFSLKPNQRKDGFFVLPEAEAERLGVVKSALAIGQRFLGRLDIPAYKDYDTWIVAGKSPKGEKGTVYAKAIHYGSGDGKPVVFRASQGKSEKIGKGKADPDYTPETHEKTGYATVDGIVQDLDVDSIRAKAAQYLNDPEWTQVGFDPRRQGGFYVRAGDNKHVPVREASEVIQIGPLVLARNAKLDFEHTGYAEGGAVMDKQMEMAFGDEGERVDPVSGNEVPIGSMPEEVRDDIPAQLSEGEYVVPADVVRFHGVKLFEDLRTQAKMGFSAMEANGRIGGEPVPAMGMAIIEPVDDLDIMLDDSDFEVVDGYAEGGIVGAASDILSGQASGLMEYRQYRNPAGEEITIMFFNGMPMSLIPEGYVPVVTDTDLAAAEAAETGSVAASSVAQQQPVYTGGSQPMGGDNDDRTVADMPTPEAVNYKELTPDELRDMVSQGRDLAPRTVPVIMGLLNPFLGLAVKAAMWHQSTQVENELKRRLKEPNISDYDKTFYEDLLEIQKADKPSLADKIFKDDSEAEAVLGKDYLSPAQLAAEAVDAQVDAEAIDASVRAAFEGDMPTGMAPIADPEAIEVTSLGDELGARDYKGPLAGLSPMLDTKGDTPAPYVYEPEAPAVTAPETANAAAFYASEDKVIADQRRDTIRELMDEKKAEREAKMAELNAQIAAQKKAVEAQQRAADLAQAQASAAASLAAAASNDNDNNDTHQTAMRAARAAADTRARNVAAGLGAQTKKGSIAGSKSGYFD